ncbi:MAG: insulinase family protein [Chloroflexi bacterium]|nr:insulinase family protein [Chloroflexota bacterium]
MYKVEVLDNGLRIVTAAMPHARSVSLSIFVGAGSRYEAPEIAGISHFVEHLCFKGTQRRATSKEISEAIEGVGGILNGGTDRELTVYWAKVAQPHFPVALDVLVDMLRHSKGDPEDVEKERQVILDELNMIQDSPQQRVDLLLDEVLWPGQPLGRDVAGTRETVGGMTREDMLGYMARQYAPNNIVVSVAGDIDHGRVVESLAHTFADWPRGSPVPWIPAQDSQDALRAKVEHRKTEQVYINLAARGLSLGHPDRFALDLLSVVLGEGMSSRLFLEMRERQGLAYEVHSYVSHFLDSGAFTVYAAVDPKRVQDALAAIAQELRRLKEKEVPQEELTKAQEMSKGRLLLSMEDSRSVSGWAGAQMLLRGRIMAVDEILALVDKITAADLRRVAQGLLVPPKLNLAVVGPLRRDSRLASLLSL